MAFVRGDTDNDLVEHPGWAAITEASAHRLDPDENHQFDLVGFEELLAEKPTDESVQKVANTLAIVSSVGTVCELRRQTVEQHRRDRRPQLGRRARRHRRDHHHP